MKIKKLIKTSVYLMSPLILILFFLISLNINIKDWKHGHQSFNMQPRSINWLYYNIELQIKKFTNHFINKNKIGLKTVNLIIPDKSTNSLMNEIPTSTKKWVTGLYLNDKKIRNIKIRYFGDNPFNYMFDQKSIRFKTKKKELVNRQRYFEYQTSQQNPLNIYIAKRIAYEMGLLISKPVLIEMIINGKSSGIYVQRERLNEGFLRRNRIMPVNIYKGEQVNNEYKIGLNNNLFNNVGLWSKLAYLNSMNENDNEDLENFFSKIQKSGNSIEELDNLFNNLNADIWSSASVYQIITQTLMGNNVHNNRISIDPWSGAVNLIPQDPFFNIKNFDVDKIILENSNNFLFQTINKSSYFINLKYKKLYDVLKKKKILENQIKDLYNIKKTFLISQKRDIGEIQRRYYNKTKKEDYNTKYNRFLKALQNRKINLVNKLETNPEVSWNKHKSGFFINIKGNMPITNLEINFIKKKPKWISIDINNDNKIEENEKIINTKKKSIFVLPLSLYANRTLVSNNKVDIANNSKFKPTATNFKFFVENGIMPKSITGTNKFTNQKFIIKLSNHYGSKPYKLNVPIFHGLNVKKNTEILKGTITVNKDLIFKHEVIILAGTIFKLNKGASIIFKDKVIANGTKENPIIFESADPSFFWGTLALSGHNTSNSLINNVIIKDGSGDVVNDIKYVSMFSLHNTKNIKLSNIKLSNNNFFDDMMHIIYSHDINISNSTFNKSKYDAIDVDISTNINFDNLEIYEAGNDGIDSMDSIINIKNTQIMKSGDKAISAGENSTVKLFNSLIKDNKIGIASKDNSNVEIFESTVSNNLVQLDVYIKNWRYGGPGTINLKNSKLLAKFNNVRTNDLGKINIYKSHINKELKKNPNINIVE